MRATPKVGTHACPRECTGLAPARQVREGRRVACSVLSQKTMSGSSVGHTDGSIDVKERLRGGRLHLQACHSDGQIALPLVDEHEGRCAGRPGGSCGVKEWLELLFDARPNCFLLSPGNWQVARISRPVIVFPLLH